MKLSEAEREALEILVRSGGAILETAPPEKNERDIFRTLIPGMPVYRKLVRLGFAYFTEEEPMVGGKLDGFTFTNEIYITDEGLNALRE